VPRFLCCLYLLALTTVPVASAAPDASPGRVRLETFLTSVTSLTASFDQQLFDEYGELIEASNGTVAIAKPGRFRWEYTAPYEQLIVTDGATLWVYDIDLEQVSINPISTDNPDSPAALLVGDVELDRHYVVTELPAEDDVAWVSLVPRGEQAQYRSVEIGFGPDGLHGMRLSDNLRQVTAITFGAIERNATIAPEQFALVPPPGVDVLVNSVPPAPPADELATP